MLFESRSQNESNYESDTSFCAYYGLQDIDHFVNTVWIYNDDFVRSFSFPKYVINHNGDV